MERKFNINTNKYYLKAKKNMLRSYKKLHLPSIYIYYYLLYDSNTVITKMFHSSCKSYQFFGASHHCATHV